MKEEGVFDLSGKVALVTGASSGLGRTFCEAVAEFGADVAVAYNTDEKGAQETASLVRNLGRHVLVVKVDVTKPDEVQHMIDTTIAELGTLDILINNAGFGTSPAKVHETKIEDWDKIMAINLRGAFLCMRAALPIMIKQKKGCIINISSSASLRAREDARGAYSVAKAGLNHLTSLAARQYARDGIRVNCIAPGYYGVRAQLVAIWGWSKEQVEKFDEAQARNNPMGRVGKPDELKALVIYLASDASSYVTGQTFVADGGGTL